MVLPASYAGYADEDYGISIPTVEDYKKLGKFAAETFTPYGDIQTGKDAYNAYQQGEYLKALANAGLIGLGYTPFGMVARPVGRLGKRVLRDKDMLVPALTDKDYAQLVARETLMGKAPLVGKSAGAATALTKKRYPESKGISALEIALRESKPEYKDAKFIFTGQNKDFADQIANFDGPPKGSVYMAPDPQVAGHYAVFENNPGKLIAFPVKKDFDISTIAKTDLPLNVPTFPKNRIARRGPLGKTIYSDPDNKMLKDQFIFKEDDFMKLKPNVIGGRGLVLPGGSALDKTMMSDIAQRIRAGAKPFDDL